MNSAIRRLVPADLDDALRLSALAGWNQTREDWARVVSLEPDGCFAIGQAGRVVATATVVLFGELAWIGMVLTDPEYRGRGFARELMARSIDYARARGAAWIKLDATDMGYPLYRGMGFADECAIERWGHEGADAASSDAGPYESDPALDLAAFGADRGRMLRTLEDEAAAVRGEGYAMGRDGARAAYFGPCVARSEAVARRLRDWFLDRRRGRPVYWDVLPSNQGAVRLAREAGFSPLRRLVRMALPARTPAPPYGGDNSMIYAIAGFEYG